MLAIYGSLHQTSEQWVWLGWAALKLWVCLCTNIEWVHILRKLNEFCKLTVWARTANRQARSFEFWLNSYSNLITMAVTFGNLRRTVQDPKRMV